VNSLSFSVLLLCVSVALGMGRRVEDPVVDGVVPDTLMDEGPINAVNRDSSLIVLDDVIGKDTIYFTEATLFPAGTREDLLRAGVEVRVWYIRRNERNYATQIVPRDIMTPVAPGQREYQNQKDTTREDTSNQ